MSIEGGNARRRFGLALSSVLGAALIALTTQGGPARDADKLRVGRSPGFLFAYTPLDVGIAKGFFAKRGLDIAVVNFQGAAKADAAIVAGALDIDLGSPMGMAMEVKGMPAKAIAVIAGPMLEFGVLVPWDSPIRSLDDLKGKTIAVATVGSITQWLALELIRIKHWVPGDLKITSIGSGSSAAAAALEAHLVDATVSNATLGIVLARERKARMIATGADFVPHFIAHTVFATDAILRQHPDEVRRFLAGWFAAVAYMRAHPDEAIDIASTATGLSRADEDQEYNRLMPGLSADGRFDAADIERIGQSFVELHILSQEPDMAGLYTDAYLPKQ